MSAKDLDSLIRSSVHQEADVHAFAGRGDGAVSVLGWHYHDDGVPGPAATVDLTVQGLARSAKEARLTHYRINDEHSNAHTTWQKMGSPPKPSAEQRQVLQNGSELAKLQTPWSVAVRDGKCSLRYTMPRQSVSLVRLEW
jgi:xylan 1,4-beta-xylosidase